MNYKEFEECQFKIETPFRMAVVGKMFQGKSTFVINFIRHLGTCINVNNQDQEIWLIRQGFYRFCI